MKVRDLKKLLKQYDDDDTVIVSSDEEGNSFTRVTQVSSQMYDPGERTIHERALTPALENAGYTEDDVLTEEEGGVPCIVFWP